MSLILSFLLVLSAYLVPASILVRPEYFIVVFLGLIALLLKCRLVTKVFKKENTLFLFFILFAYFSLVAQFLFGKDFDSRDSMILVRYCIYLMSIWGGAYVALAIKREWIIGWLFILIVAGSIVISFMQYFNVFGINGIMVPLYGEKYETLITGESWRRIIGTIGNANYWGLWLSLCFVASTYYSIIKRNIFIIPFAILLFVCIVMTGSRTALLAAILGFSVGFIFLSFSLSVSTKKNIVTLFILGGIAFLLYFGYGMFTADYYENESRFDVDNTHTLELRLAHWNNFLMASLEKPYQILIGRGPSKTTEITFGDNMYFFILRDFGLISLITYLLLLKTFLLRINKFIKVHQDIILRDKLAIALLFLITFCIFDLAADAWFNVRLVIPLLYGYGYLIMKSYILEEIQG